MKILFLTAEPPWPLDQGDKLRNYHLLKALAAEHEVTLATFCPPGEESGSWRGAVASFCRAVYPVPLGRHQMLLNVLLLPHLPVTMAARASFRMAKLLLHLTQEEHFDRAFACQLKMAGYLRHCQVPKRIIDLTDVVSLYWRRMSCFAVSLFQKIWMRFEARRLTFWEKRIAQIADLVLLVSPVDAMELKKMIPRVQVEVLPNGVDLTYFRPMSQSDRPVLLFYGHLRYPPNADGVFWFCREVFPFIKQSIPEAEFWIAGKDPPKELAKLTILAGVKVLGYVPDLRSYLEQAAVVVVPLRFGAGTRIKILEALASGRSVVSTSLGCEGLDVTSGVHLEIADEPPEFFATIVNLLRNPSRRAALAASGRRLVEEQYCWKEVGKRLLELLR
ncbi:GDP-mannose-dependent alpha-(1-6)-phosphatidylinositol monomannoside mannosyltransferase [Moorella thermoacetica]|uniref:GDP-mannose-dependent alpha-(1-6)-phosphatidylinositol monomannoside mannosyltransferase n=2 Tax=Neomoorella thermoacetica TaxID=1525 RepID=A0A1J5JMJ3_NEOTH|nr:glycosyltransferase family 4 protein [Moorella thermoacetica]OIQ07955.1 GDP-mannose-dependent alpha-(1-6)-phosphatidylinositol monomannoside mannosyltransferase [Moorella thermoacetica]